jgi:hypothetical protein
MGFGFAHFLCFLNLQKSFSARRGFATGTFMASNAAGKVVVPQLVEFLAERYGYEWMMRFLAAVSLHAVVFGLVITSGEARARRKKTGNKEKKVADFMVKEKRVDSVLMTPASTANVELLSINKSPLDGDGKHQYRL